MMDSLDRLRAVLACRTVERETGTGETAAVHLGTRRKLPVDLEVLQPELTAVPGRRPFGASPDPPQLRPVKLDRSLISYTTHGGAHGPGAQQPGTFNTLPA